MSYHGGGQGQGQGHQSYPHPDPARFHAQLGHSRHSSAQTAADMQRHEEAQRAAEAMLSSSVASSFNSSSSVASQTPSLPSYGSYLQHHQLPLPLPHPQHNQYLQPPRPPHSQRQSWAGFPSYPYPSGGPALPGGGPGPGQVRVVMTDDLVSGTAARGKLSPVRRFFTLLVTFDVLFLSLLWIIAILVSGRDLVAELHQQVLEYTIHSSMFDCVVVAVFRFLLCLAAYTFLTVSHWAPIALTTSMTVAFLAAKVFQYQWQTGEPITYDVMLILLSFVLCWAEVWFYDFRLIPLERKAREVWGKEETGDSERSPLLPPADVARLGGSTLYEGSVGNFYSPIESPNNSDSDTEDEDAGHGVDVLVDGVRVPRKFMRRKGRAHTSQERLYIKLGEEILSSAWTLLQSDDWSLEKLADNGDRVEVKWVKGKKLFKLTGYLDIAPQLLLEELYYKVEELPRWNPTLEEVRILQLVDHTTDISYQVCGEAGAGLVSTRDFVNLRHWAAVEDGVFVSAVASVEHAAMRAVPGRVRGTNGPGCFALRRVEAADEAAGARTQFQWLLDTDLRGWIPQAVIDRTLSGVQLDYIARLRARVRDL